MQFWCNVGFELVKLTLQFTGALFIVWKAVRWAQARYQKEKHWERRLGAYSDLTTALGTLLNVLAEWEDQELTHRKPQGTTNEDLASLYWGARKKLEEAHSTAMLLLPPFVADKIQELVRGLARNDVGEHSSFVERIDEEWQLVLAARDEIVSIGRSDLQLAYSLPTTQKED